MGMVSMHVGKEFEHQAWQNLCTLYGKLYSIKASANGSKLRFRRVPILKKQPEMVIKRPVIT